MAIVVSFAVGSAGVSALKRGADEARLRSLALHILAPAFSADPSEAETESLQAIEQVRAQLDSVGIRNEVRTVPSGADAAHQVIEVARDLNAQMIVVGLRRRSAVGKALLGSTAQQILLQAPCPVLAVKTESSGWD